jgi:hypothetical protein
MKRWSLQLAWKARLFVKYLGYGGPIWGDHATAHLTSFALPFATRLRYPLSRVTEILWPAASREITRL